MRPFICTRCDFGWSAEGDESFCEFCGRPGFTTYIDARQHPNMSPLAWNMLEGAAKRKEQENA